MTSSTIRRAADYGGIVSGVLCGLHCAAGPLLLAWWGSQHPEATASRWELGFVGVSGLLLVLATWRQSSPRLRGLRWGLYAVFAAAALLAERWPGLEYVQYAAAAGLVGGHWLNHRYCRCCQAGCPASSFSPPDSQTRSNGH